MEQHPQHRNQSARPQGAARRVSSAYGATCRNDAAQNAVSRETPRGVPAQDGLRPVTTQDYSRSRTVRGDVRSGKQSAAAREMSSNAAHGAAANNGRGAAAREMSRNAAAPGAAARSHGAPGNSAYRNVSSGKVVRKEKMSTGKKVLIGILVVLLIALLGFGAAALLYLNSVNDSLSAGVSEEEQLAINDALAPSVGYDEPFYMMLIGSDRRAGADWMGARADTAIVARVDSSAGTVTLVSIPRDTQIYLPGYGYQKFNAAYAYEGTAGLIKAASDLLGVDISHYAEVNFEELIELVDIVGGVTVNVPERIDDPNAGSIVIEAGEQTLDGEAALVFARSRYYYDGDFTRASNQRVLIEALAKKVLSMSIAQLPGVVSSAANCVTTDISAVDILDLAMQIRSADALTIYSAMIPSTFGEENGLSYVYYVQPDLDNMMDIVDAGGDPNDVETYAAIGSILDVWAQEQ